MPLAKRGYPQVKPGEKNSILWRTQDLCWECCNCGVRHRWRFQVRGGVLTIQAWRMRRRNQRLPFQASPTTREGGETYGRGG
jgi:hypothetical protein